MKTSLKDFWLRLLRWVLASAALCVAPRVDAIIIAVPDIANANAEIFGDMIAEGGMWYSPGYAGDQGRVVWHFPDPTREPLPLVSFEANYTLIPYSLPGGRWSVAFYFSPPGATNYGRDPGTGLVVALNNLNLTNAEPDTQMDLTVYWQGKSLGSATWPIQDRPMAMRVSYTPGDGLLVAPFSQDNQNLRVPLPDYDQVVDGTWEFGAAGVILHDPAFGLEISYVGITAVTGPYVTSPGSGYTRTSSEGQGDSFEIGLDTLEGHPESITVTAVSSNPAVFDSTDLTITATSPTNRTITLAPLRRGHGDTKVTLTLDSISKYSYVHRVQPNVAPGIQVADADLHIDQPQGFTRTIPFSIAPGSWAVDTLVTSIDSFPTNFIDPRSIFLQPGADPSHWFLVFTPRPGVVGTATEPIVLRVADRLGDHATASVALQVHVPSFPPTVLGSGSALSLNTASSVLQYAANFGGTPGSGVGQTATLEAWVYPTALPDPYLNFILQIGQPGPRAGLVLALQSDGSPSLANWNNDFYPTDAKIKVALNQWHHVAAVVNGQAVSLYVDGVLSASGTLPQIPNVTEGPTCVGIEPQGGENRHWVGHLDELRIWSVAKTASEIAASYNRSVRSDAPGLVRYYRCEEGFVPFQGGPGGSGSGFVLLMDSSVYQSHFSIYGYPSFVPGAPLVTRLDILQNLPVTFGLASAFASNALGGTVGLAREIFFGPDSATLTNGLLAAPGWPESPEVTVPNAVGLEVLPGGPSNYGERIAGQVLAPVSGVYTFAIASVNEAQLYLSPNDHPDGKTLIASSPASGVSFRQFDAFPAQQTGQVTLTAGQLYYYEVRHQVQTMGAVKPHLSVQWTLPGGVVESPIPASRLRPLGPAPSVPIEVTTSVEPDWGKVTVHQGVATYQPSSNYFGSDTVAFTIKQGTTTALPVMVEMNVINLNPNPVAGSGNALLLGGQPGGVQSDVSFDLEGQSFTVETWARRSNATTNLQALFSFLSDPATNRPYASFGWFPGGFIGLQITNTLPHPDLRSEASYTDTEWHHYAAVFDAATGQREIFRDGVSLGTMTVPGATFGEGRLFLGSVGGTSGFFEGALDEFRLWTRARTREEILGTMGSPLVGTENDLLVYYRFDEGNGLGVYDSSKPKVNGVSFDATILDPAGWITTPPTNFARLTVPRNSPGQSVFLPGFSFGRQPLTYQITGPPKNGNLVADPLMPGRYTYTPLPGFHGADSFRYTVTANGLVSAEAVLLVDVTFIPIPPTVSSIRDQELEEEDPPLLIRFGATDEDVPDGSRLQFTARSSNPGLLPPERIVFGGTGTNRTVTLDPVEDEIGIATVEINVTNGDQTVSTSFRVQVNPRLAYAVVNAGAATQQPSSYATALNASGQLAGYVASTTTPTNSSGFLYSGYGSAARAYLLKNLGGTTGAGLAINASGVVVGAATDAQDALVAFAIDPVRESQLTSLGTLPGGNLSVALDVNDAGLIVGYGQVGDETFRAFTATRSSPTPTVLELTNGYASMWATAVNNAGEIAGHAQRAADGATNAFLVVNGQTQDLGRPSGAHHVRIQALSDQGLLVGTALFSSGAGSRVVTYQDGQWLDLGDMLGGGQAEAAAVNRFGQIVGRALTTNGVWHAFLFTDGRAFDLNDLARGSDWTLSGASGINDRAQIAADGTDSGGPNQALLLFPASEIGRRVFRPDGTIPQQPLVELLQQSRGDDAPNNSFFWSATEGKLYAIRPVIASIRWRTGTYETVTNLTLFGDSSYIQQVFTNEVLVNTLSFNVWPNDPEIHIASAPVQMQPDAPGFAHTFISLIYHTAVDAAVDATAKTFNSQNPGYSVFHYLRTDGQPPKAEFQTNYFAVARTLAWNDPTAPAPNLLVTNVPWAIGTPLTNALHQDYPGLNGYLYDTNTCLDLSGPDAAYDPSTRQGSLLPVNLSTGGRDPLVVWYHPDRIGISWPSFPYQYAPHWPDDAPTLVIASGLGSGPLNPAVYPEMRIYNQPDASLPGYNPNEEHALLIANTLYALRDDLNAAVKPQASWAYVLLKYRDPASNEWRLQVYSVVAERDPYHFRYDGVVGNEIQPPMPLAVLPLMTQKNQAVSGPAWQDHDGRFYARAAASSSGEADIVLRYFYPLQPGFFYDLQRNGQPAAVEGDPIPWLDQRENGRANVPVDVHYTIQWPASAPVLQMGQTLTTATAGLPDITDMASATVVFDSLDPQGNRPLSAAVRLYDPLTPRFVSLAASFQFPDDVVRQIDPSTGYEVFPDLPYYLRVRLFHDPQNRRLGFRGFVLTPAPGANPITLINVISERELEAILALDPGASSSFKEAVERLYWMTRNPNQLDLDGNGVPDESLLVGITRQITTNSAGVLSTNLVRETLQGTKALAFGQLMSPSTPLGVPALQFSGPQQGMLTERPYTNLTGNFTMELWVKPNDNLARTVTTQVTNGLAGQTGQPYAVHPVQGRVISGLTDHVGVGLSVGTNGVGVFEHGDNRIYSPLVYSGDLSGWHHFAVVYQDSTPTLYIDGVFVAQGIRGPSVPFPSTSLVRIQTDQPGYGNFAGSIAEFRIWNYARSPESIRANFDVSMHGTETGLVGLWRFAEGAGSTVADATSGGNAGTLVGSPVWEPAAFPLDSAARYVVIAENNDPSLVGLPVGLHVISLTNSLARGALAIIQSDDVLDERVTLRHSADFGAQPENFVFQWFYQVDGASDDPNLPAFDPTAVPLVNAQGEITDPRNWIPFPVDPQSGQGVNDITLGTGQQSSLLTLSDAWYLMRYGVQEPAGSVRWSGWIGDPAGTVDAPRAMFVPGWVKRVLTGINLFGQRSSDFENYAPNTLADALASAGPRYEGDVALNPSALDNFGLIEIYSTVLNRARNLSIDGTPPATYEPADKALLDAAGNLADLYQLHADEAFADAADPTIGLTTDSTTLGSLASSVFAFQNQVGSLLEEELSLLRGRDDRFAGVGAAPVYNRLFWNFTGGDGETAYVATYGIPDQNGDGFIDAADSRILYPQGHGDAWGHYLTALTTYYDLLRHTNFIWHPRPEETLVAGVPIEVNYQDERRFAGIAAARARTGAEIVDRTYRSNYSDDPLAVLVGGTDPDRRRAWGVIDWARRTAQAAYFDWVTGNALLPAVDTNLTHTGIQKVDRTTVTELVQIVTETEVAVNVLDRSDAGFNPLGFARGVVPFDLDPNQLLTTFVRTTHFEQIYQRALQALQNAEATFNRASALSAELRKQQNSVSDYSVAVANQEVSYLNDLIEIYGYPYAGDLGPGGAYSADYNGPDLVHWMYVDELDVTAARLQPAAGWDKVATRFTALTPSNWGGAFTSETQDRLTNSTALLVEVEYPISTRDYAFQAPASWGRRRAEGRLQTQLRAMLLAQAQVRQTATSYQNLIEEIEAKADVLELRYNLRKDLAAWKVGLQVGLTSLDLILTQFKVAIAVSESTTETLDESFTALETAIPGVEGLAFDVGAPIKAAIYIAKNFAAEVPSKLALAAEIAALELEPTKAYLETVYENQTDLAQSNFELQELTKDLEGSVREEASLRLDLYNANRALLQTARDLEATLAEGNRTLVARTVFRQVTAGTIQADRYRDLGLRLFRNDALQKYDSQFETAANYVYLAAAAYDYELNLGGASGSGASFGALIPAERNLGELVDGQPVVSRVGLASVLGRMRQNFDVLKSQLGLSNERAERSRFSLRSEAFRILPSSATNSASDTTWRQTLQSALVTNLWEVAEFRRYCRPFAPESAGPQPGLVLRFGTTITSGRNFFDQPLGSLDSSYDPSEFATRIRSVAVWFSGYDAASLATKPRVYLVPVGTDRLRTPDGDDFSVRDWQVLDQRIPMPFPLTEADLSNLSGFPVYPSVDGSFSPIRRHSAFRAYQDSTFDLDQFDESTRLVGRSVWNSQWVLIIPGAYLLGDANQGMNQFIQSVEDIKLYFQTYSVSGN